MNNFDITVLSIHTVNLDLIKLCKSISNIPTMTMLSFIAHFVIV